MQSDQRRVNPKNTRTGAIRLTALRFGRAVADGHGRNSRLHTVTCGLIPGQQHTAAWKGLELADWKKSRRRRSTADVLMR